MGLASTFKAYTIPVALSFALLGQGQVLAAGRGGGGHGGGGHMGGGGGMRMGGGGMGGMRMGGGGMGGMRMGGGMGGGMPRYGGGMGGVNRGFAGGGAGMNRGFAGGGAGMNRGFAGGGAGMNRGFAGGGAGMNRGFAGGGAGMNRGFAGGGAGMNRGFGVGNRPALNSGGRPDFGRYAMNNRAGFNRGMGPGTGGLNRGFAGGGPGMNRGNFNNFNRNVSINNPRNISQTSFNRGYGNWGYNRGPGGGNWGYNRGYGWGGYGGWGRGGWGGYGGWGRGGWGYGGFYPGFGLGLGLGWGLGGWGLGGLGGWGMGWGLGGLGWGWPGYGWGGYGGWGLGGLGYGWGGYGLSPWMYGSSLYNWGYSSFYNPYVSTVVIEQPIIYDYSQPINTQAATSTTPSDSAVSNFDQARAAFKTGDYNRALDFANLAIRDTPNDAALHEFRALSLFALGRFNEAATTLYSVLAVGPGWDWPTLSGLYANPADYTAQLRSLEGYIGQNPQSAPARFVLAYHYLTQGHTDAAAQQLRQVVALQPKDNLSAQLLKQVDPGSNANPAGSSATPSVPPLPGTGPGLQPTTANRPSNATPAPAGSGKEGHLEGTWTAKPDPDTTITLTFPGPNRFSWTVAHQGKNQQTMEGSMTFGSKILTLAQNQGPALVGNVAWQDETHFTFKVPGAAPDDPGLSFSKTP